MRACGLERALDGAVDCKPHLQPMTALHLVTWRGSCTHPAMKPIYLALFLTCLAPAALAAVPGCEALTAQATERHGLPKGLLTAIAQTESGRAKGGTGPRAWPWTSNIRGRGHYYDSKADALTHLRTVVAAGERSFDVGCMQLNYHWHGARFDTLAQMIDPARNVDYAARYLRDLRDETGDWETATRYYHSRDPERGRAYLGRVRRALARLDPSAAPPPSASVRVATDEAVPDDRRFRSGAPLIRLSSQSHYWQHPALPEGSLPRLPRGPVLRAGGIKR